MPPRSSSIRPHQPPYLPGRISTMIRRSLTQQLLRARQQTAGNYSTGCARGRNSFHLRAHPFLLPSLERCYGNHHSSGHAPAPPTLPFTSRSFHSTVVPQDGRNTVSRDYPPRRKNPHHNNHNNNRHSNNMRHGGDGRKVGNSANNFDNSRGNSQFTPSYIHHLDQRAKEHIENFPSSSSGNNSALLSPWHRTTVELIMLMSKLWGRHNRAEQSQIYPLVSLSNDLLLKVLSIRKNELDGIFVKESKSTTGDTSFNEGKPDHKQRNFQPRGDNKKRHNNMESLNTEILCQTVALGWSRCDPKIVSDAAHNAHAIIDGLEDICSTLQQLNNNNSQQASFKAHDVTPSTKLYNHVLSCWARSSDPTAETHAKMLLDRMAQSRSTRPDRISYNNLLNLYANKGNVDAAEALLKQMEDPNHDVPVTADVYSYTIVMNALQRRFTSSGHDRDMKDPERAEELLSHLVTQYEKSGFQNAKLRPTRVTFGTVISMYAQADRMLKEDDRLSNKTRSWKAMDVAANNVNTINNLGWGATNAERVLDWIIGLGERERESNDIRNSSGRNDSGSAGRHNMMDGSSNPDDNDVIRASNRHFATVMDAWAKAGKGVEGAKNCERLLNRLIEMHKKHGHTELEPTPLCFGAVIDAWAKADERHESAEHAEKLLYRMEELFLDRKSSNPREMLSTIAYNLVIDAWSRRSGNDVAERAENILRRLVNNSQRTNNRFLRPDVITYTAVMKAYVNHPYGGQKALETLEEMNNQYKDGNVKARPDARALAVAMDACVKSGLTVEAEHILNDLDDSKKNCVQFNTIISGYKREGRGNEAEDVLRRMIDLSENAGWKRCSPDVLSYSLCIEAWGNGSNRDRVSRARALLDESIQRYQSGDIKCKPSSVTFIVTAQTIASSDDPDRETSVLALFEKMEEIGCEPNLVCFNVLIKTCSIATGCEERKRNALQIAASAYNSLPAAGLRADSITYTGMMHAMINLMDDSSEKVNAITAIFHRCCDEGCLNQHIVNILAASLSEDDFLIATGISSNQNGITKICSLPAEWSHRSSRDSTATKL